MKWEELPFKERVGYIRTGVKNGLRSLEEVKDAYSSYSKGGNLYEDGGPQGEATFAELTADDWVDVGTSMIPIYGTYKEAKKLYENPSWEQAGWTALSLASEIPFLKAAKALTFGKSALKAGAKATAKAAEAASTYEKVAAKTAKVEATVNKNPAKVARARAARGAAYRDMQVAQAEANTANGVTMGGGTVFSRARRRTPVPAPIRNFFLFDTGEGVLNYYQGLSETR